MNWEPLIKRRYRFYPDELQLYAESKSLGNEPMIYAKHICDGLKEGQASNDLRLLYQEAVYGTDPDVKKRVISRVYSIGRNSRYVYYDILCSVLSLYVLFISWFHIM